MKIQVKKLGGATLTECLYLFRNQGRSISTSCFGLSGKFEKEHSPIQVGSRQEKLLKALAIVDGQPPSKALINFLLSGKIEPVEKEQCWEFIIALEYAKYKGIEFGYPANDYGLNVDFLQARYTPDSNEYYTEDFGNQFNGGCTYHPTEEFKPEELTDITGVLCTQEYRSPGSIDGWGCGFKGGFFIVKKY